MLAEHWREGLAGSKAVIIANADDPLVVWAASSSPNVVWVAAGQEWKDDAWSCPSCGGVMQRPGDDWFCGECGFRRPTPSWALSGDHVLDPHGSRLADPPPAARAAPTRPTPPPPPPSPPPSACRRRSPWSACTRCRPSPDATTWCSSRAATCGCCSRRTRRAGWRRSRLIDPPPTPVILSVNARGADGTDTSWLWDVDYTRLAGHPICVIGDRKLDLAVRLEVAGQTSRSARALDEAVQMCPPGPDRGDRQLHRVPGPAPPRRQLTTQEDSEHERQQPAAGVDLPRPAQHLRRPGQRPGRGAPGPAARPRRGPRSTCAATSRSPPPATST